MWYFVKHMSNLTLTLLAPNLIGQVLMSIKSECQELIISCRQISVWVRG